MRSSTFRTGSLRPWPDEPEYDGLPSPDEILRRIDTYSEVSPGGHGLRIFARGELPWSRYKTGHFEIYNDRKFLTVTGDRCYNCGVVEDRPQEIADLHLAAFGPPPAARHAVAEGDPRLEDQEILDLLARAANREKFEQLYHNRGHGKNASSADMALACLFAFYSRDPEQIERLMRGSSLRRDKWDRRDYLPRTVDHALELITVVYSRPQTIPFTDVGNAERLVARHGDDLRYVAAMNAWLVWDEHRWRPDDTHAVQGLGHAYYSRFPECRRGEICSHHGGVYRGGRPAAQAPGSVEVLPGVRGSAAYQFHDRSWPGTLLQPGRSNSTPTRTCCAAATACWTSARGCCVPDAARTT